jgi:hypothetical protein
VLPLQKSINGFDGQLAYFTRCNNLQLTPDVVGDMLLNGIASEVIRTSYTNGIQGDGSLQVNLPILFLPASQSAAKRQRLAISLSSSYAVSAMAPTMDRQRESATKPPKSAGLWASMVRMSTPTS